MENASKALIMAGSILMSLLIIGILVFGYYQLSEVQQLKGDADASKKIIEYGIKFEQYNKRIYGSELLSLANLHEDYQKTQVEERGYQDIKINVNIKTQIEINGTIYFTSGTQDISNILNGKDKLEDAINTLETRKKYKGKTVKYYSQRSYREIALAYNKEYPSNMSDGDIRMDIEDNAIGEIKDLVKAIEEYQILKSSYTEFKNKKFDCTQISYDKYNGRVNGLTYKEL